MVLFPVSIAKLDHGSVSRCNFAGDEKAGGSWTDKIMARKEETAGGGGAGGEGAEEDEWVSSPLISPVSKYYYLFYFLLLLRRTESTSPSPGSPPGLQLS